MKQNDLFPAADRPRGWMCVWDQKGGSGKPEEQYHTFVGSEAETICRHFAAVTKNRSYASNIKIFSFGDWKEEEL